MHPDPVEQAPGARTAGHLNVIGASARAAASSALRAGFVPHASDLFGDADLRAMARFHELPGPYPEGLAGALENMPEAPFIYTGGLENHPRLVDRLSEIRPLWGNTGEQLERARDPFELNEALRQGGADPPEVRVRTDPPLDLRGWLLKPLRGAGGRGIRAASNRDAASCAPAASRDCYFQQRAEGASCSAVYAALRGSCRLLGATRQLVGERWLHARPFAWCGNVGPLQLVPRVQGVLEACGDIAARRFSLGGLFGIDFLLDGERVRPVELNPRYTASTELLEHALGFSAIALHAAAFVEGEEPPHAPAPARCIGKAIVFAPRPLLVGRDLLRIPAPGPFVLPELADIPAAGARIPRGRPVITVFSHGEDEAACLRSLRAAAGSVLQAVTGEADRDEAR